MRWNINDVVLVLAVAALFVVSAVVSMIPGMAFLVETVIRLGSMLSGLCSCSLTGASGRRCWGYVAVGSHGSDGDGSGVCVDWVGGVGGAGGSGDSDD